MIDTESEEDDVVVLSVDVDSARAIRSARFIFVGYQNSGADNDISNNLVSMVRKCG